MLGSRTVEQELFEFGTGNLMNDLLTYARPGFGGKLIFVGDGTAAACRRNGVCGSECGVFHRKRVKRYGGGADRCDAPGR